MQRHQHTAARLMASDLRVAGGLPLRCLLLLALSFAGNTTLAEVAPPTGVAAQEEVAARAAVARAAESVVQIRTIGGVDEVDQTLLPNGPTTGLVISADGWIVSSAFNFVQQPTSILVTFASGEQAPATLVATDHSRKLVLLKAQGVSGLAVPEFAPAGEVHVGNWAIAVGRTFRADRANMSVGIVSAVGRMFGKVIQTDADVSTANYGGPLVDIRGRVLGVIVPISPQSASEVAGAEWYDSGIGFAVPLAPIAGAIERMKRGEDQRAGVLGISLSAENAHEAAAEVVAALPNAPAEKAGLRKGDRIIEINGMTIRNQNDLRFALGPRYAGEEVHVVALRGDERLERTVALAGELAPFRHGFLGILPMRPEKPPVDAAAKSEDSDDKAKADDAPTGIVVRMVFPGSAAANAGVQPGDRLTHIGDTEIRTIDDVFKAMSSVSPEFKVEVKLTRNNEQLALTLTAGRLPTFVPGELPLAQESPLPSSDEQQAKPELRELKLAEFPETCQVYVPPSHETGRPAGVILWLQAPNEPPNDQLFQEWRATCDRDGLLLVAPKSADPSRWERTELEYLRRLIERVLAEYRVDPRRVVVFGQQGGGTMAYLLALTSRDVVRGVATSAATFPRTVVQVPPTEPMARLAVLAALPSTGSSLAQLHQGLKRLADAGYPVTTEPIADPAGELSNDERQQLARWIDALDRF